MDERTANSLSPIFWASSGLLLAALILGGGTKAGFLSDLVLQLAAVPVLAIAVWGLLWRRTQEPSLLPLIFCGVIIAIPIAQLVPLPPSIWTALPGRGTQAAVFDLLGRPLPWRPLSLNPQATWSSLLSLTVPLAVFMSVVQLSGQERRWLTLLVVGFSALAVVFGLSQIAFGAHASVRLFEVTNEGEATGFFANRNHFAALLYCAFLFAVAWAIEVVHKSDLQPGHSLLGPSAVVLPVIAIVLISLIAGQAMARSRAGMGLGLVAIAVAAAIAIADRRRGSASSLPHLTAGVLTFGFLLIGQFALYRIARRFGVDPLEDGRLIFGSTTLTAAQDLMPMGSGMGTFVPVFALYEKATDLLPNLFANRAHNDWVEFSLEAGALAILCIGAFLAWFAVKAMSAWRLETRSDESSIDIPLRRASVAVIGLLLAHSMVDYPLRTAAMASVFALACGLVAIPTKCTARRSLSRPTHVRYASERQNTEKALPVREVRTRREWRSDHDWPDAWR